MITLSGQREALLEEIKSGSYEHIKHLERKIEDRATKGLNDINFRVPCPELPNDIDFEEKRSTWVNWMVGLGFNEPTTAHPNICSCDMQTVSTCIVQSLGALLLRLITCVS